MPRMTIVQIGVLVFAICLTRQAVSNNSTTPGVTSNSTSDPNATTTGLHSSSTNATSAPTGVGVSLHPTGTVSFLMPVIMAASLMQRYC